MRARGHVERDVVFADGRRFRIVDRSRGLFVSAKASPRAHSPDLSNQLVPCDVCDRFGVHRLSWWACSLRCVNLAQVRQAAGDIPRDAHEAAALVRARAAEKKQRRRGRAGS